MVDLARFSFVDWRDIEEYERGLAAYLAGKMPEEAFTPFRLQMGIYGQRQEGVQMVRIKLPGGVITPQQLRTVGAICERYAGKLGAPKLVHLTTRQDAQLHFVNLRDTPAILRALAKVGLTTREACGNTVRNVTACFLSSRCPAERGCARVHARAFAQHFLRHPLTQQFPRKFKVAFSGCEHDCALAGMHDIGFIAKEKDGQRGFEVWAAGGLSSQPMGAICVESFVPEEDLFLVGEALMRIHFYHSDRKRRARARMKYVAERLGKEGFLEEYRRQKAIVARGYRRPKPIDAGWRMPTGSPPQGPVGAFRQPDGRYSVFCHLFRGDLTPAQCEAIAGAAEELGVRELLVTAEQGLIVPDVPEEALPKLRARLAEAGVSTDGARGLADPVVCPGVESCRLAITASRALVEQLRGVLAERADDARLKSLSVKVSGCQHSCGRHHVADIGLHGLARKVNGRAVPHYQLHLGGSGKAGEGFGLATIPVPARRAPEAVAAVLDRYRAEAEEGESLRGWVQRVGLDSINETLRGFAAKPEEADALAVDWGRTEAFSTKENKPGECAAAVVGLTQTWISEARYELLRASAHLDAMFYEDAHECLQRAATRAAQVILLQSGEDPEAQDALVQAVPCCASDAELSKALAQAIASLGKGAQKEQMHAQYEAVQKLVELVAARFSLVPRQADAEAGEQQKPEQELPVLDLSGVACPMNFVKTKVKLATLPIGARLAVVLDDGEPIANVPASLEAEGQAVLAKERIDSGRWRIVVERRR